MKREGECIRVDQTRFAEISNYMYSICGFNVSGSKKSPFSFPLNVGRDVEMDTSSCVEIISE